MLKGTVKDDQLLCRCCWSRLGRLEGRKEADGVILWCKKCRDEVKFEKPRLGN